MSLLIRKLAYSLFTLSSFAGVGSLSHAPKLMTNLTKPSVLEVATDAPPAQKVKQKLEEKSQEIKVIQQEVVVAAKVEKEAKKKFERKKEKMAKKEKDYFTARNKSLNNSKNINKFQQKLEQDTKIKEQAEKDVAIAENKLNNQEAFFKSVSKQFALFEEFEKKLIAFTEIQSQIQKQIPSAFRLTFDKTSAEQIKNMIDTISSQNITHINKSNKKLISDKHKTWLQEIKQQIDSWKALTEQEKKEQKDKIDNIKKKIYQVKKSSQDEFKKSKKEKDQAEKSLEYAKKQLGTSSQRIASNIEGLKKQAKWQKDIADTLKMNQTKTESTAKVLTEAKEDYSKKNEELTNKLIKKSNELETMFEIESYYD